MDCFETCLLWNTQQVQFRGGIATHLILALHHRSSFFSQRSTTIQEVTQYPGEFQCAYNSAHAWFPSSCELHHCKPFILLKTEISRFIREHVFNSQQTGICHSVGKSRSCKTTQKINLHRMSLYSALKSQSKLLNHHHSKCLLNFCHNARIISDSDLTNDLQILFTQHLKYRCYFWGC